MLSAAPGYPELIEPLVHRGLNREGDGFGLRGARDLQPVVVGLLERCGTARILRMGEGMWLLFGQLRVPRFTEGDFEIRCDAGCIPADGDAGCRRWLKPGCR
jgi:hypothetical protein